jgi:hypothetical protein
MKKVFKFPLILIMVLLLGGTATQIGIAGTPGTGTANVTVTWPTISIGGLGGGVLHLGDFQPSPLIECTKTYADPDQPVAKYKRHDLSGWTNLYLPFEVSGGIGCTFTYVATRDEYPYDGDYGVRIPLPNLKGSDDGVNFEAIPQPPLYQPKATFNAAGKYWFQLHFAYVDIRYLCSQGTRFFGVTLTCNY